MSLSSIASTPYEDDYCVPASSGRRPAREWMVRNGARLHPGLTPPSSYEEQRADSAQNPREPGDIAQLHTDNFTAALAIYQTSHKESLRDLDVRKVRNWDEVSRVYQDAQQSYADRGKGWLGLPRRLGRSIGNNAQSVIYPWLTLIPDGTYTSILKSGLTLIFGAAIRLNERRQLILDTFGNLPFLIRDTEYSFEDFHRDSELKDLITELYLYVLQCIMVMMEWLVEKAGWKQIKALLQGPGYAKNLDDMIKIIQKQLGAIDKRVNRLTRGAIISTFATINVTASQVAVISTTIDNLQGKTRDIKGDTSEIKNSMSQLVAGAEEKQRANEQAYSHMTNLLEEQRRNAEWSQKGWQEAERRKEEWERSEKLRREAEELLQVAEAQLQITNAKLERVHRKQGMVARSDELLQLLGVDPTLILSEINGTIRGGQLLDYAIQGRGHMLMQNPKFQQWLSSAQSKALLVDGNAESSMQRISGMSIVCALLAQNLPNETASVLSYFCGLRAGPESGTTGPINLIRDLLAQITHTHRLDTIFLEGRVYNELEHFDLFRLCALLAEMVKKLPYGTVLFCIIDGITWIEEEDCLQETCYIVQVLERLTRDPEVRSVFKLIITSPLACHYVKDYISREDHLSLLHEVVESHGTSVTSRHLAIASAGRSENISDGNRHDMSYDEDFDNGVLDEGVILDDD